MDLDLLKKFSELSDELFDLEVIRTDSFTGEIGEFFASKYLNLQKTGRSTEGVDGISPEGVKYQIKSKVVENNNFNYSLQKLKPNLFDYLIIIYFDNEFNPIKIYKIKSDCLNESVSISKKWLSENDYEEINLESFKINSLLKEKINNFGKIINQLREQKIIKTRHIVGDLGEIYASQKLKLNLCHNTNQKNYDAIDNQGKTYEIKTRRVYESERRIGNTRRLNNLVNKKADFLIVVTLDKNFLCNGMWKIPLSNVVNPKSAHLQIVRTTKDTEIIIPTNISWLK